MSENSDCLELARFMSTLVLKFNATREKKCDFQDGSYAAKFYCTILISKRAGARDRCLVLKAEETLWLHVIGTEPVNIRCMHLMHPVGSCVTDQPGQIKDKSKIRI